MRPEHRRNAVLPPQQHVVLVLTATHAPPIQAVQHVPRHPRVSLHTPVPVAHRPRILVHVVLRPPTQAARGVQRLPTREEAVLRAASVATVRVDTREEAEEADSLAVVVAPEVVVVNPLIPTI